MVSPEQDEALVPESADDIRAKNQTIATEKPSLTIDHDTGDGLIGDSLPSSVVRLLSTNQRNGIIPALQVLGGWATESQSRYSEVMASYKSELEKHEKTRAELSELREELSTLKGGIREQNKYTPIIALMLLSAQALLAIGIDLIRTDSLGLGIALIVISALLGFSFYATLLIKGKR